MSQDEKSKRPVKGQAFLDLCKDLPPMPTGLLAVPVDYFDARAVNIRYHEYDIYIGRAGHGHDGYYGNPHPVNKICPRCSEAGMPPVRHKKGEAVDLYRIEFNYRIIEDQEFRLNILKLSGKRLGCFCKKRDGTGVCHGDVIAEWLNQQPR